jgi:hypothetical protein
MPDNVLKVDDEAADLNKIENDSDTANQDPHGGLQLFCPLLRVLITLKIVDPVTEKILQLVIK